MADGVVTVPEGTSLTVWAEHGTGLGVRQGMLIDGGLGPDQLLEGSVTYLSGVTVPNYTLRPPAGLIVRANNITVSAPTLC